MTMIDQIDGRGLGRGTARGCATMKNTPAQEPTIRHVDECLSEVRPVRALEKPCLGPAVAIGTTICHLYPCEPKGK